MASFNKFNGGVMWAFATQNDDGYYMDLIVSCEQGNPNDWIFASGTDGFLSCVNSLTGEEAFRRRVDYGPRWNSMTFGGALSANGDLIYSHYWGGMTAMKVGTTDRPRLQFDTYNPTEAIEFGSALSLPVETDQVFHNAGCADLTITGLYVDEVAADDPYIPGFSATVTRDDVMHRAGSLADLMTDEPMVKAPMTRDLVDETFGIRSEAAVRPMSAGARALPAYLNDPPIVAPTLPLVLGPGDGTTITFDCNQSVITRGPQVFYVEVESNDPDFYNNPTFLTGYGINLLPAMEVTFVGGCLRQGVWLDFGVGDANSHYVFNQGCIVDADEEHFTIGGDDASFFQGSYVYGITHHRIATAAPDWRGRDGFHLSMQADPNWCDDLCAPNLTEDVQLGEIWNSGTSSYDPVMCDVVCKSYIDSCQNFDDGSGTYVWYEYGSPFDNDSTMGIYVKTRTVAAHDVPELDPVVVEIMNFKERNNEDVPNWKFGAIVDYDIGGDTADIDRNISTAWSYGLTGGAGTVWGFTKLPFGCGDAAGQLYNFEPMKNVYAINADMALWDDLFWDSAYYYMTLDTGAHGHPFVATGGDQEFFCTIAENDFTGESEFEFGVAQFALHGLTDVTVSDEFAWLPVLVNQWVGFDRGNVNGDAKIDFADVVYLNNYINVTGSPGPAPFKHCGDVNNDTFVDAGDLAYMIDFYFGTGPCPVSGWTF
jgi:hypothetical protein